MEGITYKIFEPPMVLSARGGAIKANWKKKINRVTEKSDDREKAEELAEKALMSSINMLPTEQQAAILEDENKFDEMLEEIVEAIDWSGILRNILTTALNIIVKTLINIILGKLFPEKP